MYFLNRGGNIIHILSFVRYSEYTWPMHLSAHESLVQLHVKNRFTGTGYCLIQPNV